MKWSYHLATIKGTEVRIHATFALLLAFVAWQATSLGGGWRDALESIVLVCTMFFCVLLHEFGHVFAARRYGILTPDITLLPIGGIARLERMPKKPSEELVVALCGPLVNVVIAVLIAVGLGLPFSFDPNMQISKVTGVLADLDGLEHHDGALQHGACLPDGWWARAACAAGDDLGRLWQGDAAAAVIGQGLAVLVVMAMVVFGVFQPMLMLIAFFVFFAAGQEAAQVTQQEQTGDLEVRDAMLTEFHTLAPNAVLREAVDLLIGGSQHDFPVLDEHGGMMGIVTRNRLIAALTEHGPGYPAQLIIERCGTVLEPRMPLSEAMTLLSASPCPMLAVMDPVHDRLVGLLTAENAGETLLVRAALRERLERVARFHNFGAAFLLAPGRHRFTLAVPDSTPSTLHEEAHHSRCHRCRRTNWLLAPVPHRVGCLVWS